MGGRGPVRPGLPGRWACHWSMVSGSQPRYRPMRLSGSGRWYRFKVLGEMPILAANSAMLR